MTYDIYRYIFIIGAILCGVMFLVSVFIFVFYNIPKVISDLSGATARKAINNIRRQNEESGEKSYKPSAFNEARGRLTDKISPSGRIVQQNHVQMSGIDTTKIQTQQLDAEAGETSVLDETAGETSLLNENVGETSLLSENTGETGKLAQTSVGSSAFSVEYEITFTHTDELISEV